MTFFSFFFKCQVLECSYVASAVSIPREHLNQKVIVCINTSNKSFIDIIFTTFILVSGTDMKRILEVDLLTIYVNTKMTFLLVI